MADERYHPVSCDYHDLLEEAAVQRREVELEFDLGGVTQRDRGTIEDVFTRMVPSLLDFALRAGRWRSASTRSSP